MAQIPALFATNAVLIASDGVQGGATARAANFRSESPASAQ